MATTKDGVPPYAGGGDAEHPPSLYGGGAPHATAPSAPGAPLLGAAAPAPVLGAAVVPVSGPGSSPYGAIAPDTAAAAGSFGEGARSAVVVAARVTVAAAIAFMVALAGGVRVADALNLQLDYHDGSGNLHPIPKALIGFAMFCGVVAIATALGPAFCCLRRERGGRAGDHGHRRRVLGATLFLASQTIEVAVIFVFIILTANKHVFNFEEVCNTVCRQTGPGGDSGSGSGSVPSTCDPSACADHVRGSAIGLQLLALGVLCYFWVLTRRYRVYLRDGVEQSGCCARHAT